MAGRKPETPPDEVYLTIAQVAALLGVAIPTVNSWMGDGPLDLKRDENGHFTLAYMGHWIRNCQIKRTAGGRGRREFPYAPEGWGPLSTTVVMPGGKEFDLGERATKNDVEIRLKIAQAEKVEMENEVRAGTLVVADDVVSAWRTILSRVRTRLLKLPTTCAPLVHDDPDMLSIQAKLKEAVNDALDEASEDWRDETREDDTP